MWRRLALFWVIGVANALLNGAHLRPMTRGRQVPNPRNVVTWIYAGDSFLDRNFNINDDDDKNYDEDEDEGGDAEESIEALVERVSEEKSAESKRVKREAAAKKKEVLQKRKDKEYDAYWKRQASKVDGVTKENALLNEYYLLEKQKESASAGSGGGRKTEDDPWDYDVAPKSTKELQISGITAAGALAAVLAFKKFDSISGGGMSTSSSETRKGPLASRSIHRDYTYDELCSAVKKLMQGGQSSLPEVPASIFSLPRVGTTSVPSGVGAGAMQVFVFWRPTDLTSVRAVTLVNNALMRYGGDGKMEVTTVLTGKFPAESELGPGGVGRGLILPDEIPQTVLYDKDGKFASNLGVISTPTVLVCAGSKIVFTLEGQRAISAVAGNALGAMLAQTSNSKSDGRRLSDGYLGLLAADSSGGSGAEGGAVKALSHPTRLAVDAISGLVYASDTGNHRVLELQLEEAGDSSDGKVKARVKRVFGSASGQKGDAAKGVSAKGALFNRPMGLSVDPIDRYLYVADSNNDAVRRVDLGPVDAPYDVGKASCIVIESAAPDVASDGSVYTMPELQEIERLIGKKIGDLQSMSADEAAYLLEQKGVLREEYRQNNPLATEIIGRSRPLLNPTDIVRADAFTYVSAASSHQVWRVEGNGFSLRPVFGSGLVGSRDSNDYHDFTYSGAVGFLDDKLRLGSPAGMAAGQGRLFVVDSEASSIRLVNLIEGFSNTIVGGQKASSLFKSSASSAVGNTLLAPLEGIGGLQGSVRDSRIAGGFGDVDSVGYRARLSLPSALTSDGRDSVLLCDTLNGKVKAVQVRGSDSASAKEVPLSGVGKLCAPQGIVTLPSTNKSNAPQKASFVVADTGNDRLLLATRSEDGSRASVQELELQWD